MQNVKCEECGQEFPMNDTFMVSGNILCENCYETVLDSGKDVSADAIQEQIDPTVCCNCSKDNGEAELPKIAGLPICEECEGFFRDRPFPTWIRFFFAGLVALVLFSLWYNARFIEGYIEMKRAVKAFSENEIPKAAELLEFASGHVPESESVRVIASYTKAVVLLQQDRSEEALALLKTCIGKLPEGYMVDQLIMKAKIGVAFDNKDYDGFLEMALGFKAQHPAEPVLAAQVASAYACKYAVTGEKEFEEKALLALNEARAMLKEESEEFEEYEGRILHRLHTREVINRKEFLERFPNGWKEPKGE